MSDAAISDLATTANTLLQQYRTSSITLQEFKDSINSQVVPTWDSMAENVRTNDEVNESNDEDIHKINYVIRFLSATE